MKKEKIYVYIILSVIVFAFFFLYVSQSKLDNKEENNIPDYDWFEKQRAYPFDEIPYAERLKALDYVKNNMTADKMYASSSWTLAGPTNVEGRITTIAIHPANPQIVYAGCANGGVWKSTNFCQSWTSIFDNENTSSIGALAIDPNNPNIIYCGTGEANSLRSYYPGTGIYKSTDAGNSWTFIGLNNSFSIGNISINRLNTNELYAAAVGSLRHTNPERGIYKSTNGGINWTMSLFVADSVGAIDVAVDPVNPNRVFGAMWERMRREDYIKYGGPKTALYLSTNSGLNWNILSGGFPSGDATLGRISLDISVSNPLIVYALTSYANGNSRGLYKTTDGGTTWSLINSSVASSSNYAWFNRICKVNPTNPNIVYCGGLYMENSTNGGTSFTSNYSFHVDHHAICFTPSNSNYIVIGNDGGIHSTTNAGTSWTESTSLPVTQFYAGDISYLNPGVLMGGCQDNGTNRTTTGNLNDWYDIYGGDGFYCLFDYTNTQRLYAESQNGAMGYSANGGSSFSSGTNGLDLTYTNWSTPFIMDKTNPLILYTGTYKIYKTINGMQSWTAISPDLTNGHVQNLGTITTLDVSKSNPAVLYCGTDDANVWVTTNNGTNWTKIISGLPNRWVTRVTVHPDSANVCYVTHSGYKVDSSGAHVFRTTNYGNNWTSIHGNLPNAPINVLVIDPNDTKTLIIGTDAGVMITRDIGATWNILGGGLLSSIPVHDLKIHNPSRKLVAFTHGRSAYSINLSVIQNISNGNNKPEQYTLFQNYPNPFNPSTKIRYDIKKDGFVSLKIYDLTGKEVENLINENQKAGTYEYQFSIYKNNLASGAYFYKLQINGFTDVKRMLLIK
jgi:photosystem II stability/assembly factor-like uncharacterized protein